MTNERCARQSALLEALERDALTGPERAHLVECPACRDHLLAVTWLTGERERAVAAARPAAAALVWRAARQRQRDAAARRVVGVLSGLRRGALLTAAGASVLVLAGWPALRASLAGLSLSLPAPSGGLLESASLLLAATSAAVALLAYGIYTSWVEE